jgi:uncharacterized protein with GYD domain
LKGIKPVYFGTGEYDLIAAAEVPDLSDLNLLLWILRCYDTLRLKE